MELINTEAETKYASAKKRVEVIKGFYRHLTLFLIFIAFLLIDAFIQNTTDRTSLLGPIDIILTIFFWGPWGLSILIHGIIVFDVVAFFSGKEWEERTIKKMIGDDEQNNPIYWE